MWESSCPQSLGLSSVCPLGIEACLPLSTWRFSQRGLCLVLLHQLHPVRRADNGLLPQRLTYLIGLGRPFFLPPAPRVCGLLWKSGESESIQSLLLKILANNHSRNKGNDILLLVVYFILFLDSYRMVWTFKGSSRHEIKTNFIRVLRYYWPLWLHWLCTDVCNGWLKQQAFIKQWPQRLLAVVFFTTAVWVECSRSIQECLWFNFSKSYPFECVPFLIFYGMEIESVLTL